VGDLAASVGMSPSHFHRVFKSLTGVTPKGYAAARRADRLRSLLRPGATVTSAVYRAGFASSGRFYAKASRNLGMKPSAFRDRGTGTKVRFAVGECSLGSILVAASEAGVCSVSLGDDPRTLVEDFQKRFANARLVGGDAAFESWVGAVVAFVEHPARGLDLPLDVQGTAFQQRIWNKLREIPFGRTRTYAQIARDLGVPQSSRAVARACAANPLAVAIPCHRVIRTDGSLSGFRWGVERKARLLAAEGQSINPHRSNHASGPLFDRSAKPAASAKITE
jgi:AraC family transcriptional regulator of adaptative response/methylated-DNA-[protein]-cysteine methyltransferase